MAMWDKVKGKVQNVVQGNEQPRRNSRANGGTSGYRYVAPQRREEEQQDMRASAFGNMMPDNMYAQGNFQTVAATDKHQPVRNTEHHNGLKETLDRLLGKKNAPQQTQPNAPQQGYSQQFQPQTAQNQNTYRPQFQQAPQNPYQQQFQQTGAQAGYSQRFQQQTMQSGYSQRFRPEMNQGQPVAGQPMNGQPVAGQPVAGQPVTGQPVGAGFTGRQNFGQPVNGQMMNGQPVTGQPVAGQTGNSEMFNSFFNGRPMGQTANGQPVNGQPVTGRSQMGFGTAQNVPQDVPVAGQGFGDSQRFQPETATGRVSYMPGSFVDEQGHVYRSVLNVAQVTSVSSCYRLIEYLQNNEILLVNAEDIADAMEARRCLDILYGASLVLNCTLTRVSSDKMYIITPPDVKLAAFDGIRVRGENDLEQNWPHQETYTSSFRPAQGFTQQTARHA